ncbi:MAG: helix-turn-helix domain-containing protein [Pseudomonadota bacterium]
MIAPEPPWTVKLSTDALPARDRIAIWREEFGRTIFKNEISLVPGQPFREAVALSRFPGLGIVNGSTEGRIHTRKGLLLADGNNDFILTIVRSGTSRVSHLGRELVLEPGGAFLASAADSGTIHWNKARYTALALPRNVVTTFERNPEALAARSLASASHMLRLLADYIDLVSDHEAFASAEMQRLFVSHVHDLAALALGVTGDPAAEAKGRGLKAARLHAIKADIRSNLNSRSLTIESLTRRHGISASYVRRLFADDGTSYTDFVLDQRLARALRLLTDARLADRTISAIAFECGFGDLSYFNRVFRRRYGMTPSDMRAASRNS